MTRRLCLALDLVEDADLIADYERWHQPGQTPAPVIASIRAAGIEAMEIYRAGSRMFMLIEARDDFSEAAKAQADAINPDVQAWVRRMAPFQKPVPAAGPDGSWMEARRVFCLADHDQPAR